MSLAQERENARSLATRIVAFSIGLMGVVMMAFAFFLTFTGGASLLFLSLILFVIGAGVAALGFFFQLVPFKLDELAAEKRAYDVRVQDTRAKQRGESGGGGDEANGGSGDDDAPPGQR